VSVNVRRLAFVDQAPRTRTNARLYRIVRKRPFSAVRDGPLCLLIILGLVAFSSLGRKPLAAQALANDRI